MPQNISATRSLYLLVFVLLSSTLFSQPASHHDLVFDRLATTWDEGFPLGNGMLGCLLWQKENNLRLSLDRADLWDLRPMKGLHLPEFSYEWITQQVQKKEYEIVQQYFDAPYEKEPAPTKIPGGALEFDIAAWGPVESARLSLENATCHVRWKNGTTLQLFVHATLPIGWFRFENVINDINPTLAPPRYEGAQVSAGGSVEGDDLSRLGYTQGAVERTKTSLVYRQEGWGGLRYEIAVKWKSERSGVIEGAWSISSYHPEKKAQPKAGSIVNENVLRGFDYHLPTHTAWWREFWNRSAIRIPDSALEKQWYLEQYKFGSASRRGAPPISLQAVWTADNGRIPPWKGDYHHDLNTQLSYWPCYSGNHLEEGLAYFDHLEENRSNYERFTKLFFRKGGLAVPGVTTLEGTEMGWMDTVFTFSDGVSMARPSLLSALAIQHGHNLPKRSRVSLAQRCC